MSAVLDRFVPRADAGERHEITIHAPAGVVLDAARNLDLQSVPAVRAIFWLRSKVLGAKTPPARPRTGLVEEMLGLGWGRLAEEPGRFFVAGAACQPWEANVVFSPIPPEQFAAYAEPDRVKIAWTLEAEALGPALTRFATETRVFATDEEARRKFRRYWRIFGIGIVLIRRLLLPAIRRQAERQWPVEREGASLREPTGAEPMNRPASLLAAVTCWTVAGIHLLRIVFAVPVTAGDLAIPLWASVPALIFFGGLGVWIWLERRR